MFEPQEAVKLLRGWNPKTVCVVSNKCDLDKDWSDKVDACDVVIRVNRMCSYNTGKAGKKMDLLVEDCSAPFFSYSRTERNQHLWGDARFVMFTPQQAASAKHCIYREQLADCAFIPEELTDVCVGYTTAAIAVLLADKLWPEVELYFLGDIDRYPHDKTLRWPTRHETSTELDCINRLVKMGRLVSWLTDPDGKSKPRSSAADSPDKDFLVKKPVKSRLNYEYARVVAHDQGLKYRKLTVHIGCKRVWSMAVAKYVAVNGVTGEMGALVYNAPDMVIVDWDSSGRKCYALCSQAAVWSQTELPGWAGWKPF